MTKQKEAGLKRFESRDEQYTQRQDAVEEVLNYLEHQLAQQIQSDPELHERATSQYPKVKRLLFHAPALFHASRTAMQTFDLSAALLFANDYKRYFKKIVQAAEGPKARKRRRRGKPRKNEDNTEPDA